MIKDHHIALGKSGEDIAAGFLKKQGYRILRRNYKIRLGEIDIIASEKDTICFVEVRTRRSDQFGLPQETILPSKQKKIAKTALSFLKERNLLDKKARFDVVSVTYSKDGYKPDLIKDAFGLEADFVY